MNFPDLKKNIHKTAEGGHTTFLTEDNNGQLLTTNKTECLKSSPLTQMLKVGHCGSVCRR